MKNAARETALAVLSSCRQNAGWSDGTLKAAIRKYALDSRDAALATHICYGVLQNRALLDFYIGSFCTQRPAKLEPLLLDILRIGAYQILFLDKVPASAAVNAAVEMTKAHRMSKASGLVNAVLRKLTQHSASLPPLPGDAAARLSLQYSHPAWLVERLLSLLGEEETEAFLRADNGAVPTTVQYNPLKTTPAALAQELSDAGVKMQPQPLLDGCWEISGGGSIEALPAFAQGRLMVQDTAAKLAALAAGVKPDTRVLDVCAAPGGKSFAAAMAMENRGEIVSCDIHAHKLLLIESGAARLGVTCVKTALADGRKMCQAWCGGFDTVICDVPCSGIGIIRKKPDIRYKDPAELQRLPAIQWEILDNVSSYVKPGGVLLYSTCTVLPQENEQVTERFLQAHPDFAREAFTLPAPIGQVAGQITLWPQRNGTDGFYICRLVKKG